MSSKSAQQLNINFIAAEDPLSRGAADIYWPSVRYTDDPRAIADHGSQWRIVHKGFARSGCGSGMQQCADHPFAGVEV